jgi:hypothetical protein
MFASESPIDYTYKNSRIRTPKDDRPGKITPALLEQYIESKKESDNTTNLCSSSSSSISLNQEDENEKSSETFDMHKSSSSSLSKRKAKSQVSRTSTARSNSSSKSGTISSASSMFRTKTSLKLYFDYSFILKVCLNQKLQLKVLANRTQRNHQKKKINHNHQETAVLVKVEAIARIAQEAAIKSKTRKGVNQDLHLYHHRLHQQILLKRIKIKGEP